MKNYLIFDAIGKITMAIVPDADIPLDNYILTDSVLTVDQLNSSYINKDRILSTRLGQLTTLNKLTLTADGIDTITISNAPDGTFTATNTATQETVSGNISGTDAFSTTIAGTYHIIIESFPYLDFEATIEAI